MLYWIWCESAKMSTLKTEKNLPSTIRLLTPLLTVFAKLIISHIFS